MKVELDEEQAVTFLYLYMEVELDEERAIAFFYLYFYFFELGERGRAWDPRPYLYETGFYRVAFMLVVESTCVNKLFECRMESGEHLQRESKEEIVAIYSDFMMRIAQFDELVPVGSRFLVSFQQALGFLRRPPIDKTSTLVERILNAHRTRRFLSYFEAGCANNLDRQIVETEYDAAAKVVVDELESFLGNAASVVQTANDNNREDNSFNSVLCIASSEQTATEKDEEDMSSNLNSFITSTDQDQGRPDLENYGSMMAFIYSMVKQDYTMQVDVLRLLLATTITRRFLTYRALQDRIVSSLNLKCSQEELETYCQMWSLRPFVDDDMVRRAWNLVPGR
ncbi:hypothetical protein SASPL_136894 [Salvia splendens]|uniref:DUF7795 domain-containing protein n=1 Tax=Salvia splendens TaxID=180675 RepID=A0A8X8ZH13_SALSN|nr:hypothetical protein SASPL_136894 [Salvia splendens]